MEKIPVNPFAVTRADLEAMTPEAGETYYTIDFAQHPLIRDHKISMHSKPNRIKAVVPDLSNEKMLTELGLQKEGEKWYVANRKLFSQSPWERLNRDYI